MGRLPALRRETEEMTLDEFRAKTAGMPGHLEINVELPDIISRSGPFTTVITEDGWVSDHYAHVGDVQHHAETSISQEEIMIVCSGSYDY